MEFDRNRYKVHSWKSPLALFWMLNPLTFLLELCFGQRLPNLMVIDKTLDVPEAERTIVPCPHCGKLHDSRTWSWQFDTVLKNWFGLYCNHCGRIIPCLLSLSSFIILSLTYPIWVWFEKSLKDRWMLAQPARFRDFRRKNKDLFGNELWVRTGLAFGAFFFLMIGIVGPLIDGEPLSWSRMIIAIPIATITGLAISRSRRTNQ